MVARGKAEGELAEKRKGMKEEKREGNWCSSTAHCSQEHVSVTCLCGVQKHEYNSVLEKQIKLLCQFFLFPIKCFTASEFCELFKAILH